VQDTEKNGRKKHNYATEAVRTLLPICFNDLGLRRIVANCSADNVASVRLMERIGFRRESHTLKDSLHRFGEWLDGLGYTLTADEWRLSV
jgi:RimJ/RimL family protein N-acetyltransferase